MGSAPDILLPELQAIEYPLERFAVLGAHSNDPDMERVDLWAYTCTCLDFQEHRAHFPPRDVRRACPHIIRAVPSGLLHASPLVSVMVYNRDRNGVPPFDRWVRVEVDGKAVVLARLPAGDWVDVYATSRERDYRRFRWNLQNRAWKYSNAPYSVGAILKEIEAWTH
jgi:hypothetical protein